MANNELIVDERQRDIGNFMVGRLLPFRKKRQVGPFTFIDHMGPSIIGDTTYFDIDQHPHIGLSTLTYLLKGEIEHQDSMGNKVIVTPGDVAFMTSGKGVTHTERTPAHLRNSDAFEMHGYQIWVALPKAKEEMNPEFAYYKSDQLPKINTEELSIVLTAGEGFGMKAPLMGYSPMFMVDVTAKKETVLDLCDKLTGELAIVVVSGSVGLKAGVVNAGQMMISKTDTTCILDLKKDTRLLLFGGEPLPEERFLLWNFVSHDKRRLEKAKQEWINKRFPKIKGDNTYIPFPQQLLNGK